jgi:hypothetical protein
VQRHHLKFSRVEGAFAVCQLAAGEIVPDWCVHGAFFSFTRAADELSIVCPEAQVPHDVKHEKDWACCRLEGPFAFSQTGILASFLQPLAEHAIPIFAISTFNTDYVLIKGEWMNKALQVLRDAGHEEV